MMDHRFEESLIVMDLADRLRYHDQKMAKATDLDTSRQVLRQRIKRFYASQGQAVDDRIIDMAIEQRISQRLLHVVPSGARRWLARCVLACARSTTRVVVLLLALSAIVLGSLAGLVTLLTG